MCMEVDMCMHMHMYTGLWPLLHASMRMTHTGDFTSPGGSGGASGPPDGDLLRT